MHGKRPTWRERLAYKIDTLMSLNPLFKLFGLAAVTTVMVVLGGLLFWLVVDRELLAGLWSAWTYIVGGGFEEEEGVGSRAVAVLITIFGMLVFALLLGLVSETLGQKLDDLKKGRSRVIEEGHTVILGWSEKIYMIIEQLAEANANLRRGVVAVLAPRDKEAMEEDLQRQVTDFQSTIVVCRSGLPTSIDDLNKVSVQTARAVILLADPEQPEESDVRAIKAVLALRRGIGDLAGHAVVELIDGGNREIVELVGQGEVELVVPRDVIGRLMVQTSRQKGLAQTYAHLLAFEGSEFYLASYAALDGQTFAEAWPRFPDAVICGVRRPGGDPEVMINPPDDLVLVSGDQLLVLAEDDDTFDLREAPREAPTPPPEYIPPAPRPEHLLFLGWRKDIGSMILELDDYVAPGSRLALVFELPREEAMGRLRAEGVGKLAHLKLSFRQGSLANRRDLEALDIAQFDSILVLADETADRTPDEVDARTLMSLLLIRDIQKKAGADAPVMSEIRDPATKDLAQVAEASDYVVSNEIVSMLLTQVAENRQLNPVWADLLQAEGSEIYLKPARRYAAAGEALSFHQLQQRARQLGEIAFGLRIAADDTPAQEWGLLINPADKQAPRMLEDGDRVIVLAEDG